MALIETRQCHKHEFKSDSTEQRTTRPTDEYTNHIACNGSNGKRLLSVSLETEDNGH